MKSIKSKIIVFFSTILLVVSSVFGFISLRTTTNSVKSELEESLVLLARDGSSIFESRLEEQSSILETLANLNDIESMDWEKQEVILRKEKERRGWLDLGVIISDGRASFVDGTLGQDGNRDYITRVLGGEKVIYDFYINQATSSTIMTFVVPIQRSGSIAGALVAKVDGEILTNIIEDLGYGDDGFAYIINDEGTIIAHRNRQMVMEQFNPIKKVDVDPDLASISDSFKNMLSQRSGIDIYEFNDEEVYTGFAPINNTVWIIASRVTVDEVMDFVPEVRKNIIITTLILNYS